MSQVFTITGSDNSGWSGLQVDLRIITEMGGHALTSATCIVMQDKERIGSILNFPTDIIHQQVENIMSNFHPQAVKVGLIRTPDAVAAVAREIVGCRRIVVAPGIMSSNGTQLIDGETIEAIKKHLVPMATLLVLRQIEAERMLGITIATDEDMLTAARMFSEMGAENVMIRGGQITEGRLTALLYTTCGQQNGNTPPPAPEPVATFFSSYNIDGWQQHGVGGALSAAIATRLSIGDDVRTAIANAHEFIHSRVVYSVKNEDRRLRPADIYNTFMNLLSNNYSTAHDVAFYAERLNITTRYLSQITNDIVSKSPKQIIADYLMQESRQLLANSRLSVKEIADTLGFSTHALFCNFFKQQSRQTPSEYRLSVYSLSKSE